MLKVQVAAIVIVLSVNAWFPANAKIASRPQTTADNWMITSDIECGNSRMIERVGADHFAIGPREDPIPVDVQRTGPISNYVICVEVRNLEQKAREITIDVVIPEWLIKYKFDYFLRKPYLLRSVDQLDYDIITPDRQVDFPDRVQLKIPFEPRQRRILTTIPAYPFSHLQKRLVALERRTAGKAQIRTIGQSADGRPILSIEAGDKSKPRAVFLATLQPGEPATWGLLAMAEAALFNPECTRFLNEYNLAFVPMTNPDGVVDGSNNVNGKGEPVIFGFSPEARAAAGNQEAKVLWEYLSSKPPTVLIDFHFLSLPNHSTPRPYNLTALYNDEARRHAAELLVRRLERLTEAPESKSLRKNDVSFRKHLLAFNAVLEWNAVATLYQNTGPLTSHQQAQTNGVRVMKVALDPEYLRD